VTRRSVEILSARIRQSHGRNRRPAGAVSTVMDPVSGIWRQLPEAALWVIGTFIGIDLMFVGWSWLMLGMALRHR